MSHVQLVAALPVNAPQVVTSEPANWHLVQIRTFREARRSSPGSAKPWMQPTPHEVVTQQRERGFFQGTLRVCCGSRVAIAQALGVRT